MLRFQRFPLGQQVHAGFSQGDSCGGPGSHPRSLILRLPPARIGEAERTSPRYKREGSWCKLASAPAHWIPWGWRTVKLGGTPSPLLGDDHYRSLLCSHCQYLCCPRRTSCMIRPQSLMSKQTSFCGVLGHAFVEFLKSPGDYCQAQHDLYEDQWTVEIHYYYTKKPA